MVYQGTENKIATNPYVSPKLTYTRVTEFDSNYIGVWDGPDPTNPNKTVRVIACRGTELKTQDIREDRKVYVKGFPDDLIHYQLAKILRATPQNVTIDVCAHSLGTSLVLESYLRTPNVEHRVRRTYLFNPVFSPSNRGISRMFENNSDIRWFMNTADVVSVEGQGKLNGGRWPKNVTINVGREPPLLHAKKNHTIYQWFGKDPLRHPKAFALRPRRITPSANLVTSAPVIYSQSWGKKAGTA